MRGESLLNSNQETCLDTAEDISEIMLGNNHVILFYNDNSIRFIDYRNPMQPIKSLCAESLSFQQMVKGDSR
jgi:hypothetical protein